MCKPLMEVVYPRGGAALPVFSGFVRVSVAAVARYPHDSDVLHRTDTGMLQLNTRSDRGRPYNWYRQR